MKIPHSTAAYRSGFTLLEILVVILIITILATIVGVNVAKEPDRARVAKATAEIATFRTALQLYRMDNGMYPTMPQGLNALCDEPKAEPLPSQYRSGGYLGSRNLPLDPWSNPYVYLVPGPDGAPYEIVSYGSDGEPGGEGEAGDIRASAQ
jgi:general secretion pathway protein G